VHAFVLQSAVQINLVYLCFLLEELIDNYTCQALKFLSFAIKHKVDHFHVDGKLIFDFNNNDRLHITKLN
jgi:hypothetical protein